MIDTETARTKNVRAVLVQTVDFFMIFYYTLFSERARRIGICEDKMRLRKYRTSDCGYLAELFCHTVHSVNAKDYTKEQLDVWATGIVDLKEWNESFSKHYTVVAVENHEIIGFGDIDASGYLDRLFVHQDHQGEGIASAICDELEYSVSGKKITTHSSITARAFFEHRGYRVIQEQTVIRNGISLTNFIMEK